MSPARADDPNNEDLIRFDIPRQRADLALTQFAEQADITLIFPYDELQDKTANPLVGAYTVREGATILLESTGFELKSSQQRLVMNIGPVELPDPEGDDEGNEMSRRKQGLFATMVGALAGSAGSGDAVAQERSAAAALLEEVIVTATRREAGLQSVPLSAAAVTAEAMQVQGVYNIDQLGESVANLTFGEAASNATKAVFIRGIGNVDNYSIRPIGAAFYLDGHYMPSLGGLSFSTLDIERVEVLRGPQGTLFGKNATGGAISVVTAKPGQEFDADILARIGDFGQQDMRAMVNIPLSETVASRFSVSRETTDGYFYNRTLGRDFGGTDSNSYSAALRITPGDHWTIDLSTRLSQIRGDEIPSQCGARPSQAQVDNLANMNPAVLADPALAAAVAANHPAQFYTGPVYTTNNTRQFGNAVTYPDGTRANVGGRTELMYAGATVDAWNDCNTDAAMGDFVTSSEKESEQRIDNQSFNVTAEWDSAGEIGGLDNLTVRTQLSRQIADFYFETDLDWTSVPIAFGAMTALRGNRRDTSQFEVLFTGDVSDRLQFVAGVHLFDDEFLEGSKSADGCLALFEANLAALSDPNGTLAIPCSPDGGVQIDLLENPQFPAPRGSGGRDGFTAYESRAIFGNITYALSDAWTLDLGVRWTEEDRHIQKIEFPVGRCSRGMPGDPPVSQPCEPEYVLTYQTAVAGGTYNNGNLSFSEVTPALTLTRSIQDDSIVYFRYAKGFNAGSFNDELNIFLNPQLEPLLAFDPETVNSYEVGYKGTLADGRVQLSSALFFMDYTDKQEEIDIDNSDGRFGATGNDLSVIQNASSVDIYGLEFEVRAQPWDGGFITTSLGWLENEYGDYNVFDIATGTTVDRSNTAIEDFSPEWTLNASIGHEFRLSNGASLTPQLGLYYQSEYDFLGGLQDGPPSMCFQDSYSKLRARMTYVPAGGSWQASLFGNNITDERYIEYCRQQPPVYTYRYGQPDAWGLEFNHRFGR